MEQELGQMEQRFAELIWQHAPVASGKLAAMTAEAFGWKKSTMYTMLKRLCKRGLFENEKGTVKACITREEYHLQKGKKVLAEGFGGSLPGFLTAFARHNRLSEQEIEALRLLIEEYEEGDKTV